MHQDSELITAPEARHLLGRVSEMWLWRRLKADTTFPRPIRYAKGGPRYWRRGELAEWIESHREPAAA